MDIYAKWEVTANRYIVPFKKAILAIKHSTKQEERNLQEYPYRESKILIFFERMFVNKLNIQTGRYFNDYTARLNEKIQTWKKNSNYLNPI